MTPSLEKVREALRRAAKDDTDYRPIEDRILAAIEAAGAKVMFREPTNKMFVVGGFSFAGRVPNEDVFPEVRKVWEAMFDAAPSLTAPIPELEEEEEEE